MKRGIGKIVGRRIARVVVREGPYGQLPNQQVLLVFDDGTCFELYSLKGDMHSANDVYPDGHAFARDCPQGMRIVFET